MKMRHKGIINPSSSTSSSSSPFLHSLTKNVQSVLKFLPATILAKGLVLPLEDREVLAYMMTRSMDITTNSSVLTEENTKKASIEHKSPLFDCECFECYISYWFRWDCSPNREIIHQAIEAFEEELNNGEEYRKMENKKKIGENGFSGVEKMMIFPALDLPAPEIQEWGLTEKGSLENVHGLEFVELVSESGENSELMNEEVAAAVLRGGGGNNEKGLGRNLLSDMLGLFNFRLWSLWKIEAE